MDAKHVARRGGERSLGRRTNVETSSRARTRRRRGTGPLREDTLEGHRGARACVSIGKFSDANVCEERASRYQRTHVSNGGSMDTRRTARPLPCDGCCTLRWIVDEQQAPPMASMRPEGLEMRTPRCQGTNARGVDVPMASTSASRAPKRLVSTIGGTTIVPFPCTFPSIPSHRGPRKDSRNRGPNTVHPRRVFLRMERARMHSVQRRQGRAIPCATMESDRPDTFAFRVGTATFTSLLAGSLVGALTATWKDVPAVERNQAWPALVKTGRIMGTQAALFAAVGGTYAGVECLAEEARGTKDSWNGILGGIAAGGILGIKAGRVPAGLAASAALAATSAIVDLSGQTLSKQEPVDDAIPPRQMYPYE